MGMTSTPGQPGIDGAGSRASTVVRVNPKPQPAQLLLQLLLGEPAACTFYLYATLLCDAQESLIYASDMVLVTHKNPC